MHIPLKTNLTSKEFHISVGVMALGTRLTVLVGYVFPWMKPKPHINIDIKVLTVGPLIWGPTSELYGRLKPLYVGYAIFIVFQVPVAFAQNIESSMLGHFRHLGPGSEPGQPSEGSRSAWSQRLQTVKKILVAETETTAVLFRRIVEQPNCPGSGKAGNSGIEDGQQG
jgi:hypothetical protein